MIQFQKFDDFRNFKIWEFFEIFLSTNFWTLLFKLEDLQTSRIFSIWKNKIWLHELAILKLFVHSIFLTDRNFANSHIRRSI